MPTIGLVGVGLIGRAWANVFARAGWDVVMWDANPEATAAAPQLVAESLHDLARHGLVTDPEKAAARLRTASTLEEAVKGVDLVQESGPERLEDKLAIWARLDAAAAPQTVLASSTSAIVASLFTANLAGRSRCLVAHPVNPPHLVPIVELCGAPWTSKETVARARSLYSSVGQVPIEVKKEIDGFILNRLQIALLTEAFRLVDEGYVTPQDLDHTIADGLGLRWSFMGPFETIELNAPKGMADYCERYGDWFRRYMKDLPKPAVWEEANWHRVVEAWGPAPAPEKIAEKSLWRNERLAALAAHKKAQRGFRN
ncbi:MAG: 3-hydroxyacyl-CoA dehydrogenase [Hyphomicrobiaceae bacterium]